MLARWKRKQKEHKENAFPGLGKVRRGTNLKDKTASLRRNWQSSRRNGTY